LLFLFTLLPLSYGVKTLGQPFLLLILSFMPERNILKFICTLFIREKVHSKQLAVRFICSADKLADIITKTLATHFPFWLTSFQAYGPSKSRCA